jgi:Rieske Fe-S protein
LEVVVGLVPAGTLLGRVACRRSERSLKTNAVEVPLTSLPVGGRVTLEYDGEPVEVARTESGVVGRYLSCTHFGCPVKWQSDTGTYLCPCHDGRFDAEGRPIAGPPNQPLRPVPAAIQGSVVRVGER